MKGCFRTSSLVLALPLAGILAAAAPGSARGQAVRPRIGAPAAGVSTILSNRKLWGPDGLSAMLSLAAWRTAGEKQVSVFPAFIISETPFRTRDEAARPAALLDRALKTAPPAIAASIQQAWQGQANLVPAVAITQRFIDDRSVRVSIRSDHARYLPQGLTMAAVIEQLGAPESTRKLAIENPGDSRPVTLTLHSYASGAIIFAESTLAPPGAVARVVLNVPAVSAALFKEAK